MQADWKSDADRRRLTRKAMRKAVREQESKGLTDEETRRRAKKLYRRLADG